ncbi:MAG: ABC transporter ATP-binding protein [Gammaproteobacteria bacterium]
MSQYAIECQSVCKSYGNKYVLDDVSLKIAEGEFFGLVGMNGSGKTTLIKAMLDLTACDSGTIKLFGKSHRMVSAREHIAYLPDRFTPPAYLRCQDFLAYMLALHNSHCDIPHIHKMFDELELDKDVLKASVISLSKGMTQKLGLISCLLSGKKLLVLDEPMSGLDPRARVLFKQQLKKLKADGASVFFSSHALADVEELADNMAVLHHGKVRFFGSHKDFKKQYGSENLEQAYMNCVGAVILEG